MSIGRSDNERSIDVSSDDAIRLLEAGEQVAHTGSWEWIPESGELRWSANLYRLMGVEPGAITPTPEFALRHAHPHDRERVSRHRGLIRAGWEVPPLEYRVQVPGLGLRYLRSSIARSEPTPSGEVRILGVVQDITDERLASRAIAAHIAVVSVLSEWDRLETSAEQLLCALGEACECVLGVFWLPHGESLAARSIWSASTVRASEFEAATFALSLGRDVGLPGRAWASMQPETFIDIEAESGDLRREPASRAGLRGGLAVPAVHGDEVLAVVELYSPDPRITEAVAPGLAAIGPELGMFLARRRGQLGAPALTPRELDVLRAVATGRATVLTGKELGISAGTAKNHLANVYRKLGVRDRAAAVALALRLGLID